MSGMLTRRLTLCAGLVMLGAGSASGQPVVKEYLNYCRTGSLRPCASVRIETEYNASGGTDVRISVQNLGWYGGADDGPLALYQVEIEGRNSSAFSGSASDVSVSTLGGATTGGTFDPSDDRWIVQVNGEDLDIETDDKPDDSLEGHAAIYGCDVTGVTGAYYQTCGADAWVVLSFSTSQRWAITDESVWGMELEFADLHDDDIDCETWSNCAPVDASTAPEPITVLLLGSGLLGIGGVGLVRQRRRRGS